MWEKAQLFKYLKGIDVLLQGTAMTPRMSFISLPEQIKRLFSTWSVESNRSCLPNVSLGRTVDIEVLTARFARTSLISNAGSVYECRESNI